MSRIRYQHKILQCDEPTAGEAQLDEFGEDGWELVQIYSWANKWFYVFKRIKGGGS